MASGIWSSSSPFLEMYAVVQTGGKQYKVAEGDTIEVNRVSVDAGSALTIDNVLMLNQDGSVKIGSPTIEGAKVQAEVIKHTRGPKLIIWKMKRRKGYRNKNGHRQDLSLLKINKISG
jgi:large subunit ribosomal protein L21